MRLIYLIMMAVLAFGTAPLNNAAAQSSSFSFERSVIIPGHSYRNAPSQGAAECGYICQAENQCRAWTYDMLTSHCWLKDAAPKRMSNTCCISGVKNSASDQIN
jgi:PAN domain